MSDHAPAQVFNAGWDDDPDWKAICECGWEIWNCPTENTARLGHSLHALGGLRASDAKERA